MILHHPSGTTTVLSNVRHTYITPPGEGFLPTDTAKHHRDWAVSVIRDAMVGAGVSWDTLDVIAYTKGQSELGTAPEERTVELTVAPTRRSLSRQDPAWEDRCPSSPWSHAHSHSSTTSRSSVSTTASLVSPKPDLWLLELTST